MSAAVRPDAAAATRLSLWGKCFLVCSIVLPGKVVTGVYMCVHACTQCVYVEICRASHNHRRVASYLSNLPEIPLVTTFVLTLINPYVFILPLQESLLVALFLSLSVCC